MHYVATADQDVHRSAILQGHLDGPKVAVDTCAVRDTVDVVMHARVDSVGRSQRFGDDGTLCLKNTLELSVQLLPLLREAVAVDQSTPVVRVLVEAERRRPDGKHLGVLTGLRQQDVGLGFGQVVRVGGCLGVGLCEVVVDLVTFVASALLNEFRSALAGVGGRDRGGRALDGHRCLCGCVVGPSVEADNKQHKGNERNDGRNNATTPLVLHQCAVVGFHCARLLRRFCARMGWGVPSRGTSGAWLRMRIRARRR